MVCGVPVICSGVTSLPEVVGDAALTFDPTDVDDIAGTMLAVLSDPGLRATLIHKGRERATHFTWQSAAARTIEVYRSAAKIRAPR
jgi:glycosyltransferase involved in cell wall biosynthesis